MAVTREKKRRLTRAEREEFARAFGYSGHVYAGECPDDVTGEGSRDRRCKACKRMDEACRAWLARGRQP